MASQRERTEIRARVGMAEAARSHNRLLADRTSRLRIEKIEAEKRLAKCIQEGIHLLDLLPRADAARAEAAKREIAERTEASKADVAELAASLEHALEEQTAFQPVLSNATKLAKALLTSLESSESEFKRHLMDGGAFSVGVREAFDRSNFS